MANIKDSANYEKLKNVLKEVFQLDQADLDFGIYRIMNQKRNEINDFLEKRLLPQVTEILSVNGSGDVKKIEQELKEKIQQLKADGFDPDEAKSVKELRAKLSSSTSIDSLEQEVYSHLANFFKRYYKDGDFISLRRYKKDVYAIPYEGEEVKLHWANNDQYYIKTSEYLKNYGFKLPNGKAVKFELKEASTEQNNNKEQSGKERRFELFHELPLEVSEDGNTLVVNFTYEEHDKKVKQDKLNAEAVEVLIKSIPQEFHALLEKRPTDKNKNRTLLEKHILDFTARNSFDYFIHKDLGGFLSRELDFYIKNEVLYLDDINTDNEQDFTTQLSKVKAIKQVAQKIITFLAQIENFQKKLWLKKKFVVSTNYCITLDRIPEKYYQEIAKNKAQIEEWKRLFKIDKIKGDLLTVKYSEPLSIEFLKSQPYLVVDTKHFTVDFKETLLAHFDNLEDSINGILLNSDNYQALNLLRNKYHRRIDITYIDPPYNTESNEIIYKNGFKHSSWLSLMSNRLEMLNAIQNKTGVLAIAIDSAEQKELGVLLKNIYNSHDVHCIPVVHNPRGIQGKNISYTHEYLYIIHSENEDVLNESQIDEKDWEYSNLRNWGGESERKFGKTLFYPVTVNIETSEVVEVGEPLDDDIHPKSSNEIVSDKLVKIYPIDANGVERKWRFSIKRLKKEQNLVKLVQERGSGNYTIQIPKTTSRIKSVWNDKKYDSSVYGKQVLTNILPNSPFTFPKSIHNVIDCLNSYVSDKPNSIIVDFFGGSGTTGHATININRTDNGNRKYVLVEMGEYFNTVTKPRIQKVIYSDNWKNGIPVDSKGISSLVKYHDVESYEDTLNNLSLVQNKGQESLLSSSDFKDEYTLSYMLDVESRDNLLNVDVFKNPFNYKLNITRNNESQETVIDLVETFNYLIGLHVKTMQTIRGFKVITGVTNERDEETLVIWRNTEEKSNEDLNEFFTKMEFSTRDSEFQRIYVNGDNHLENLKTGDDNWKVVLIEEEFMKRMFDVQDV